MFVNDRASIILLKQEKKNLFFVGGPSDLKSTPPKIVVYWRNRSGPISNIYQHVKCYDWAKFGAFIKKRTIISPYCPTNSNKKVGKETSFDNNNNNNNNYYYYYYYYYNGLFTEYPFKIEMALHL